MTFKEKAAQVRPDAPIMRGPGLYNCPYTYGLERERICINATESDCEACWNRQIPGTEEENKK